MITKLQRFIQATMELVDKQEYGSWKLPKDWHILLTTNPDNSDYFVSSLDDAQKTRFITFNLKFDVDDWAKWAEHEGIDSRTINFLLFNPELVTRNVNPRSIVTFFNTISSIKDFSTQLPLIQMLGEASVGSEFASLFTLFINNRLDKLITPKDILHKGTHEEMGMLLTECIGKDATYRADIASVLVTRTINYGLVQANTNSIDDKTLERVIFLCTNEIFTNDLEYVVAKKLFNGNKQKFQKMISNDKVADMILK